MKFTTAYYILLLYITVMARPLVPVISDVLSHAFSEAEHIATVHAKYGNNHLQAELAHNQSGDSKSQSTLATQDEVQVHMFVEHYQKANYYQNNTRAYSLCPFSKHFIVYISKHIPPPKFFVA